MIEIRGLSLGLMTIKSHATEYIKENGKEKVSFQHHQTRIVWMCVYSRGKRINSCVQGLWCFVFEAEAHFAGGDTKCTDSGGFREAIHWHIFWECPMITPFLAESTKKHLTLICPCNFPHYSEEMLLFRQ